MTSESEPNKRLQSLCLNSVGQYPITLDNINVMDMNLSVRVNVDFHIGISPVSSLN